MVLGLELVTLGIQSSALSTEIRRPLMLAMSLIPKGRSHSDTCMNKGSKLRNGIQ